MHRRPHLLLPLLALALLGSAHALDAAGLAPALEATFPASVAYLDCPFKAAARTCVLVPDAANVKNGTRVVLDFLRSRPGVQGVQREDGAGAYAFRAGDTAYRLRVTPSRARPGMVAATLSFAFGQAGATHAVCLQPNVLFDLARLPSLTPGQYASMATAITCHGADPTDARGRTPLWAAVASGNIAAVRTLLRGGADPNHIADSGWTPLLVAGHSGTRRILNALLQAGGDPTYIAPDGATLASLQPFNAHLASRSQGPGGAAVLPELPGTPPEAGSLTLARPAVASTAAARPAAPMRPTSSPAASSSVHPAQAAAAQRGKGGRRAAATERAGTPARSNPPEAGKAPARKGEPRPFPTLPLAAVLLAVAVVLGVRRARQGEPQAQPTLTDSGTEWQAPARPKPLTRHRRARRLDGAQPWNEPLG